MNNNVITSLTRIIWVGGAFLTLYDVFPDLWGTLKFAFYSFNGLFSDLKPDEISRVKALRVRNSIISVFFICLILQLLIFAFPFVVTQSGQLVKYYEDREKNYVKALSGRLSLAQKLTDTDEQVKTLKGEVYRCRQQVQYLSEECTALTEAVALSRQTLTEQISQHSKLNTKGDF